jgi:hypothetical protein
MSSAVDVGLRFIPHGGSHETPHGAATEVAGLEQEEHPDVRVQVVSLALRYEAAEQVPVTGRLPMTGVFDVPGTQRCRHE